ncbi:MAG: alpha/beta hydrolase-fold protein [Pseudomonadota bacterium]
MIKLLPYIEVNPNITPMASVIWLHGLGADGHDFEPIVADLKLSKNLPIRFIFPTAPPRAVTINQGMIMPAWYDLAQLDPNKHDEKGIGESEKMIGQLIEHEISRGISSDKITLAGFSQGGVIALHTGLRYPKKLAGILSLSAYLPFGERLKTERSKENINIPIFMAHGITDNIIPIQFARLSYHVLKQLNYKTDWHDYPMEHSVCTEEVNDISRWLREIYLTS